MSDARDTSARLGILNLYDFAAHADLILRGDLRNYAADGVDDEITYGRGRYVFDSLGLVPRYLVDVSAIDTSSTILGSPTALPILPAPTVSQTAFHPQGELATYRAAAEAGVIATIASVCPFTFAQVREAAAGPSWCEVAMLKNRSAVEERVKSAEAAGCTAVCWSLDCTFPGAGQDWAAPAGFFKGIDGDAGLDEIAWLRKITTLPIVVRGILRDDEARACVERGASGIVVANHRARLVDGAMPAIEALPAIVRSVGDRAAIVLEGGVRSGLDVFKALALGAKAVMIGRPVLWGLATAGAQGVRRVLDTLTAELSWAMQMSGAPNLAALNRDLVVRVPTLFETAGALAMRQDDLEESRRIGSTISRHHSKSSRWDVT